MPFSVTNLLNKAADRIGDKMHKQADRSHSPHPPDQHHDQPHHGQAPLAPHDGQHPSHGQRRAYWQPGLTPAIPLDTVFRHETGAHGWGNNEAQNYTASSGNSFFGSDALHIRAVANHDLPNDKFTSARLTSHATLNRDRGVLSVHITAPVAKGIWPAFWLLPADPFTWPTDGEVDVFEAWDGSTINHSCLHWGHFNGPDHDKHRVIETELGHKIRERGVRFDFAWMEGQDGREGRMVWYVDGKPVMKAAKPAGTRPLRDYRLIINVAMGGNVCGGKLPDNGTYEMTLRELGMWEEPVGGWDSFERDWKQAREGHP